MATQQAMEEKEKLRELYNSEKEKEVETMRTQFVQNALEEMKKNEEKIIFQYTTMLKEEKKLSNNISRKRDELSRKVRELETEIEILKEAQEHDRKKGGRNELKRELKGTNCQNDILSMQINNIFVP
ncbi:tropomyosin-2-like [Branchiostoma lanceolatum]|uniref:tropomyosin-2-like n=1 Tax=Branchiostoma lanceolatum TaxID=7740 RepID=UPI00345491BD